MNVTLFIHRFDVHGRRAVGGMLGNMMVATEHRTFFPAVELLRQVIRDVGYAGPVCIEVEDGTFDKTLAGRQAALKVARNVLAPFFS